MTYQWLFFDADGTLFNYELAEQKALQETFRGAGLSYSPQWMEIYRRINQQIWVDFENGRITARALRTRRFELLFDRIQCDADAAWFGQRYLENLACASDLLPDAEDVLRQLHGHYRLVLITNGLSEVQRPRLESSGIRGLFELVVISEEIGAAKPDAGFFDYAMSKLGSPSRQSVLVIGDSLSSDIQGGFQYGLDTCWYNPVCLLPDPRFPPTYEIHELGQLLGLLES